MTNVIRYRLEASEIEWQPAPGRTVRGYGFNGQVPGPVIEARQGVPLEIDLLSIPRLANRPTKRSSTR